LCDPHGCHPHPFYFPFARVCVCVFVRVCACVYLRVCKSLKTYSISHKCSSNATVVERDTWGQFDQHFTCNFYSKRFPKRSKYSQAISHFCAFGISPRNIFALNVGEVDPLLHIILLFHHLPASFFTTKCCYLSLSLSHIHTNPQTLSHTHSQTLKLKFVFLRARKNASYLHSITNFYIISYEGIQFLFCK